MADSSVAITAGTGTPVDTRTESTNSEHRQVVVLGDPSTNAGVAPVDATNGLAVQIIPALPAGSAVIGATLGKQVTISTDVTRPADTTAYAINDAIANSTSAPTTGGFTFSGAARISGGSGIITDLWVASSADPATPLQGEVIIFDQAVTAINDNAAFAVSDAEIKTALAIIPFTLQDMGNNDAGHVQNLSIGFTCVGSADLRFLVRAKNAYAPASAEVFTYRLKITQVD